MTLPPTPERPLPLFLPRTVGLLALFGGIPLGFVLSLANLKRVGDRRGYGILVGLWILVTLALVGVGLYLPLLGWYLVILNLVSAGCFYLINRAILKRFEATGRAALPESGLTAIGLGFGAWVVWYIVFSGLLVSATYAVSVFGIRLS
jgi:hypothetical protein